MLKDLTHEEGVVLYQNCRDFAVTAFRMAEVKLKDISKPVLTQAEIELEVNPMVHRFIACLSAKEEG